MDPRADSGRDVIAAKIGLVRARIAAACERVSRDARDVTLVAVSKTHPALVIAEAYAAGQRDFGENRVQEGVVKIDALRADGVAPAWHLLGPLQTNKVRAALNAFDILHGVDSLRLAKAISDRAEGPVRVFLEVNAGGEASKHGVAPEGAGVVASAIGRLPNIDLLGLMTVAPMVDDPEDARPVFRKLRELRDAIGLRELSMGITVVRVGRAIFGPREG